MRFFYTPFGSEKLFSVDKKLALLLICDVYLMMNKTIWLCIIIYMIYIQIYVQQIKNTTIWFCIMIYDIYPDICLPDQEHDYMALHHEFRSLLICTAVVGHQGVKILDILNMDISIKIIIYSYKII